MAGSEQPAALFCRLTHQRNVLALLFVEPGCQNSSRPLAWDTSGFPNLGFVGICWGSTFGHSESQAAASLATVSESVGMVIRSHSCKVIHVIFALLLRDPFDDVTWPSLSKMFNEEDSMFSRNLQDTFKIAGVNLQEAGDSFGISRPLLTLQSAPFIAGDETVLEII